MKFDFWNNEKRRKETSLKILADSIKNEKDLQQNIKVFNQKVSNFQKLIEENQKLQSQLQAEQQRLSLWEEDLKNRMEENRKTEISLHIRSEGIKKDEQRLQKKDKDLESERKNIKERETLSSQLEKDCFIKKEKYDKETQEAEECKFKFKTKIDNLNHREDVCKNREKKLEEQNEEYTKRLHKLEKREAFLKKEFEKEKKAWDESCEKTKATLDEKIMEYDRKIADLENIDDTLESIKADQSDDGNKAKIVVKEAIRAGIHQLEDTIKKFQELDETYGSGTFKGFAVPFDEISTVFEELKAQYDAVKNHAESTGLDFSLWLSKIEEHLLNADQAYNSYLFSECYRNAVEGLSYCNGYATMIEIFNNYAGGTNEESADSENPEAEEDWNTYYSVLFEEDFDPDFDYDSLDFNAFKKQYKKVAKKYHPDRADDDNKADFEEKIKILNEIWEKIKSRFNEEKAA